MHPADLIYRRELVGWTRRQFAGKLGRSYQTVANWENGITEIPAWLYEWLEYMDGELVQGRAPEPIPKRLDEMWAVLRPQEAEARASALAARKTSGKARKEMEARRAAGRQMRHLKRINRQNMLRKRPLVKG
jgi:transcriptional regulator with XRE-family HTH domain